MLEIIPLHCESSKNLLLKVTQDTAQYFCVLTENGLGSLRVMVEPLRGSFQVLLLQQFELKARIIIKENIC